MRQEIKKLLVANRSEIAIRVFRAATELGIRTVAIYAEQDRLSLHRFKADQAFLIGKGKGPLEAYLAIDEVLRVARETGVDAIHPGYGFLSESPEFAEACRAAGIIFIGPTPKTMRTLGNKVDARNLAVASGVPVMPASPPLPDDPEKIKKAAAAVGYPVMLKASWGGGGRGMRVIEKESELLDSVMIGRREAKSAFGKDEVYLEKLIRNARHVEVQILGDTHGNLVHLFERDCSIQRRNQKLVERAPAPYLDEKTRLQLCESALKIGRATNYVGAGTVEFLMDTNTGAFYFIEVNPRIQVEHTVTEVVTGLDIVKAQIKILEGGSIGAKTAAGHWQTGIPGQNGIRLNGHALQCRITTENPENNFIPDFGRISAYRGAMGFGIRIDGGTAFSGAVVTRYYDPLLEKLTAWAPTTDEVIDRMNRALQEYRIRGVATNLAFLHNVVSHPRFRINDYTTRFIDDTPGLFDFPTRQDRATKLLTWIADVTVNGHPETRDRPRTAPVPKSIPVPVFTQAPASGTRQILETRGATGFAAWVKAEKRVLVTDTTMRDAHQSLLATRMRTRDIVSIVDAYARGMPQLLSLECWGGATFDVAMRYLKEDPWERLALIREKLPNILTQMLLRGSNGVGYTNYPDNVVRYFVKQAAAGGMDLFRIFDCFNWVENMRVSIDAVCESGKLAEGAICYTGDILDPKRAKYSLKYYVALAKELEKAGVHILGIKDMAGLLKPAAARILVKTLKDETSLPVHLHTHDTTGISAAAVLAAVDAGVDAIDAAMDSMSGGTSQPCLGSIVAAIAGSDRDSQLDIDAIRRINGYWEGVRAQYSPFESGQTSGASEVYLHEMPGGQFTNLKEQARSLGFEHRWSEVADAYRAANDLFGDIIKVTPSSKVVGDMALMMVAQDLTPAEVLDPKHDVTFPNSVIEMMRGELGQPPGGWPPGLQERILKGEAITVRPGALLGDTDLEAERTTAEAKCGRKIDERELAAYLMYPKVYSEYAAVYAKYGPVSALPTEVFYGGMKQASEITVELSRGKAIVIQLTAIGETRADGQVEVFFELNGQPRVIKVPNRAVAPTAEVRRVAEDGNDAHVPAPMPGSIASISIEKGQPVKTGDVLLTIEAMKMETSITAPRDGVVSEILVSNGNQVSAKDLMVVLEPASS